MVTRVEVKRQAVQGRFRWQWSYTVVGDDGKRFQNTSLVELRSVLKRAYGRDVEIVTDFNTREDAHAVMESAAEKRHLALLEDDAKNGRTS